MSTTPGPSSLPASPGQRAAAVVRRSSSRVLPLLISIAREIQERRSALVDLEFDSFCLGQHDAHAREVAAEIATHRRELRRVFEEVERLGWSVTDGEPPRFRFRGRRKARSG
jgi:hypothetical protein